MKSKYSAGIVSESFWFQEFKIVVDFVTEGKTDEEIRDLCIKGNAFGAAKEYRAKRMWGYITKRVKSMDSVLLDIFNSSDLSTQKIIDLITILRKDKLFFDFMYEIYREKVLLRAESFETVDLFSFFTAKQSQDETLLEWKDATVKKVLSTYVTFLEDANLIKREGKNKYVLTPPLLDIALLNYLESNNESSMAKAITGAI